jgi:mannosyl-oligosaccharide glucosidase
MQINPKELSVGVAALSNLLGGIGYFYGQSKIALPKGFTVSFRVLPDN